MCRLIGKWTKCTCSYGTDSVADIDANVCGTSSHNNLNGLPNIRLAAGGGGGFI